MTNKGNGEYDDSCGVYMIIGGLLENMEVLTIRFHRPIIGMSC